MKKILKFSCISGLNAGDVIISEVLTELLHTNYKVETIDIINSNFDARSRVENPSEYKVPESRPIRNVLARHVRKAQYILRHKKTLSKKISEADIVIIGGGQLIDDYASGHMLFMIDEISKLCRKHQKRLVINFVGVSQLMKKNHKVILRVMLSTDAFNVRDERSKDRLLAISRSFSRVTIAPDPVLLVSDMRTSQCRARTKIGINVMNLNRITKQEVQNLDTLAANLSELSRKTGLGLKIINTAYGEDLTIAHRLKLKLKCLGIEVSEINVFGINDVASAYSDISLMISNRMHSGIISLSYSIPTLIYNWHPKVTSLLEGIAGDQFSNMVLQDANANPNEVIEKFNRLKHANLPSIVDIKKYEIKKFVDETFYT